MSVFEILDGDRRELDASHELELVQRDRLAGLGLLEPELRALIRAGDAVQQRDDVARVRIGVVERAREQRTSDRPWLNVHALGEPSELLGLLASSVMFSRSTRPWYTEQHAPCTRR